MSTGNLSGARLARLHDVMAGYVAQGSVPGVVTLVWRRGELHVEAIGKQAVDGEPMRRDTIFRIASMTKPIAAVAAMMLVEECKLRLDDPVDSLLPELADRKVLRMIDGPLDDTVPANRSITVRDVLTFRMGFGFALGVPDTAPILKAVEEQELGTLGPMPTPLSPDEWLKRFATLPLMYQPGERWQYNTAYWLLALLITRASGQSLETFLQERIFGPLCMKDTGFSVPSEKLDRLASFYDVDHATGKLVLIEGNAADCRWSRPPAFPSGGGELVSTVDDYLAFGEMMLNKGKYNGERILSRPSVEAMITDQITPEQKAVSEFFPGFWEKSGWGFGVSMVHHRNDMYSVPRQYGWAGGYGTSWANDPAEQMIGIVLTQVMAFATPIIPDFWASVYQAVDD